MSLPGARGFFALLVAAAVVSSAALSVYGSAPAVILPNPPTTFAANGRTFGITYIAANQSAWERGLMDRRVDKSTTMLFVFPAPRVYSFWMSNVNSSLDIVWLDVNGSSGRVVFVVPDAPGCSSPVACPVYTPWAIANRVIEAEGGFAAANGIGVGTNVTFA